MRALEQRTVFSTQRPFDIQKGQLLHRERIRSPKKSIDNDEPYSCTHNVRSVKLELLRQARQAEIKQQNAHLANRIYKIMASPGGLHTHLHAPVPQLHSTNYSQRVRDAMRIHNDNMTLARKLESVEPHYTSVAQYSPRAGAKPQASAAMNADRYARQLECLNFLAQKNPLPSHHKTVYSGTQVSQQANLIFEYAKLQGSVYIDVKVYHVHENAYNYSNSQSHTHAQTHTHQPASLYIIEGEDFFHHIHYQAVYSYDDICALLKHRVQPRLLLEPELWMTILDRVTLRPVGGVGVGIGLESEVLGNGSGLAEGANGEIDVGYDGLGERRIGGDEFLYDQEEGEHLSPSYVLEDPLVSLDAAFSPPPLPYTADEGAGLEFDESALAAEIGERNEGRNTSSKPQSSPLPPSNSKPSSGGGMGRGGRHLVSTINSTQVTGDDAIDL